MLKIVKALFKKLKQYVNENVHNLLSTVSNMAYVLIGYIRWSVNPVIGLLLIILGIASTGFHWTRTKLWNQFDLIAIFYVFSTIAGWLWVGSLGIGIGLLLGGLGQIIWYNFGVNSRVVIGVFGVLCMIPYYMINGLWSFLNMIVWFALALIVSHIADHFDPEQDGIIYDTLHALWHIFSSIGILYLTELSGPAGILLR